MRKAGFRYLNFFFIALGALYFLPACRQKSREEFTMWRIYRGDEGSNAYSQLAQINTGNVKQLEPAWIYCSGDPAPGYLSLQTNPIVVRNILYGISPLKAFALHAGTGKELWKFDPFANSKGGGVSRELTYWESGDEERIFMFAASKLIALDAKTGKRITNFGDSGYVDLNKGLRRNDEGITHRESVGNTSSAIIYKDLIITGSSVEEDYESSPGHIRGL